MREARREIDAVVDSLKSRASSIAADAERRAARLVPTGDIGAARADARALARCGRGAAARDAGVRGAGRRAVARPAPPRSAIGWLSGPLGLEGIVQSMHDGAADVDVRGKRLRARVEELRVLVARGRRRRVTGAGARERGAGAARHGDLGDQRDRQHVG